MLFIAAVFVRFFPQNLFFWVEKKKQCDRNLIQEHNPKIAIFRVEATSALAGFMRVLYPGQIGIWKCCPSGGSRTENPEKNPRGKAKNQQQTQPAYDAGSGNRTPITLAGGECPRHRVIPPPQTRRTRRRLEPRNLKLKSNAPITSSLRLRTITKLLMRNMIELLFFPL